MRYAPHLCEPRPFVSVPWFIFFVTINAIKGAASNRDRSRGIADEMIRDSPAFLRVPPELETVSEQVLMEITATEMVNTNPFAGKLQLLAEPRLTSSTAWYLQNWFYPAKCQSPVASDPGVYGRSLSFFPVPPRCPLRMRKIAGGCLMARRMKKEFPGVTGYFDRHKKRRFRFRSKGFSTEIHGEYGSETFRQDYEKAIRGQKSFETGFDGTRRGTINALIVPYYKSPQLASLSNSTKMPYRYEIERLRNEHGHRLVDQMKRQHVVKLLEPLADRPSARNNRLKLLRMLLNHAAEIGWCSSNPTTAIKKMHTNSQGFHTWTEVELGAPFCIL